jgi:hypothetical protein
VTCQEVQVSFIPGEPGRQVRVSLSGIFWILIVRRDHTFVKDISLSIPKNRDSTGKPGDCKSPVMYIP